MEKPKTDASVKAGLQIEGESSTQHDDKNLVLPVTTPNETDVDELVHRQVIVPTNTNEEQDADELVHTIPQEKTDVENSLKDPDDLVHLDDTGVLPDEE